MFCQKCGKENPDGAKFCNSCSTALTPVQGEQAPSKQNEVIERNKTKIIIIGLVVLALLFIILIVGSGAFSGDDGKVISIGHEGFDKIANDLPATNYLTGQALDNKLTEIAYLGHEYYGRLSHLNPDTEKGKTIRRIMMDFFLNAEYWAKSYQSLLKTDDTYWHDYYQKEAIKYKGDMMDAVSEFNNL